MHYYEQSVEREAVGMGKMPVDPVESYPERVDEPDCAYYMRTGLCGYGSNCKYNHPPHMKQSNSSKGEFPERVGQPECQYFLKTGTCKFGASCKYHHPRDRNGFGGQVQMNYVGFPMRQGEKECAYYMRTGTCKYGAHCKFDHPQPATLVPVSGYASTGSPTTPASPYPSGLLSWPLPRGPYVASPRMQGSPAYMPVIFSPSQGMLSMPAWNNYQGPLSPLLSPERHQQPMGSGNAYNSTPQTESSGSGVQGVVSPFVQVGSAPMGQTQREAFPERHGQPECQYYMKTGDCKFGTTCKYHHPKERVPQSPTCMLSPMGLPLRPDQQTCTFYARYGICKFGPTCKFDHPLGGTDLMYSPSSSSLSEQPVAPYPRGGSPTTMPVRSDNSQVVLMKKDHPAKSGEPTTFKHHGTTNGSVCKEADTSLNSGAAEN
uniref:C3H1-type domain-containing protein n=1 Tax=Araucaria cunninghamii TaxID=56994 RepID=A0A0D6R411_ARACU